MIDIHCKNTSIVFSQNILLQNFEKTLNENIHQNILYRISLREALWWGPRRGPPRAPYTDFLHGILSLTYSVQIHPLSSLKILIYRTSRNPLTKISTIKYSLQDLYERSLVVGTPSGSPKGSLHRLFTWKSLINIFCTNTSIVFSQNILLQNFPKIPFPGALPPGRPPTLRWDQQ